MLDKKLDISLQEQSLLQSHFNHTNLVIKICKLAIVVAKLIKANYVFFLAFKSYLWMIACFN